MAYKLETGAAYTDSTSYCSIAVADDYLSIHPGVAAWTAATQEQKETALSYATRMIDQGVRFSGQKQTAEQALEFPRVRCYDTRRHEYVPTSSIPLPLKQAVAEMALVIISGGVASTKVAGVDVGMISSISVPDLSISLSGNSKSSQITTAASDLLRRYGWVVGASGPAPVTRV